MRYHTYLGFLNPKKKEEKYGIGKLIKRKWEVQRPTWEYLSNDPFIFPHDYYGWNHKI